MCLAALPHGALISRVHSAACRHGRGDRPRRCYAHVAESSAVSLCDPQQVLPGDKSICVQAAEGAPDPYKAGNHSHHQEEHRDSCSIRVRLPCRQSRVLTHVNGITVAASVLILSNRVICCGRPASVIIKVQRRVHACSVMILPRPVLTQCCVHAARSISISAAIWTSAALLTHGKIHTRPKQGDGWKAKEERLSARNAMLAKTKPSPAKDGTWYDVLLLLCALCPHQGINLLFAC